MTDRSTLWAGLAGIGLVALCCALPLLVVAIGASALLAWATHSILVAAGSLIVAAMLVLCSRFRRTRAASECCNEPTGTPLRKL